MVDRNKKIINDKRKKVGKQPVTTATDNIDRYYGYNWIWPSILIAMIAIFIGFYSEETKGFTYWFTVAAYPLLAFYFFWFRRPFLFIGKAELASRRFRGVRGLS